MATVRWCREAVQLTRVVQYPVLFRRSPRHAEPATTGTRSPTSIPDVEFEIEDMVDHYVAEAGLR
jgi:hypothetical protein